MFRFGPQKTEPTLTYYINLKKITVDFMEI